MTKYSIKCQLFGNEHADGTFTIRMRVAWKGNRVDTLLPIYVPFNAWMPEKEKVKESYHKGASTGASLNGKIDKYKSGIAKLFAEKELYNNIPTVLDIKCTINSVTNGSYIPTKEERRPFYTFFDDYFQHCRKMRSTTESTIVSYQQIQKYWKNMGPHLTLKDINEKKMEDYVEFCLKHKLHNSTIAYHVDSSKTILHFCKRNGLRIDESALNFSLRLIGTDYHAKEVIYLTWEEIMQLMNHDFKSPNQTEVSNILLLGCFTGLRFSDIINLQWTDIYDDSIHILTRKTNTALSIELNKYSKAILDRQEKIRNGNRVFKERHRGNVNGTLKVVGRKAGINTPTHAHYFHGNECIESIKPKYELLSTHCGRKSFVINAMRLGISSEVIMQWTGHSDHSNMKPYMKIISETKKENMAKFDQLENLTH